MVSRPEIIALREAYTAYAHAAKRDRPSASAIQVLVCAVVDVMKADGWPPERVVVAVKSIAREAGLSPSASLMLRHMQLGEVDELLTSSVRWCIERYYDIAAIEVTTKEGRVFHCRRVIFPSSPELGGTREVRWVFSDDRGFDHVGPMVVNPLSPESLTLLVEDWWAMKKAMREI
jgi:hypothetical protein